MGSRKSGRGSSKNGLHCLGHEICAIQQADRKVVCWGNTKPGMLVRAEQTQFRRRARYMTKCLSEREGKRKGGVKRQYMPFKTKYPRGLKANTVAVGYGYGCAITLNGCVSCWGTGDSSVDGPRFRKECNLGQLAFDSLTVSDAWACGLTKAVGKYKKGEVKCWGRRFAAASEEVWRKTLLRGYLPQNVGERPFGTTPMKSISSTLGALCGVTTSGKAICRQEKTAQITVNARRRGGGMKKRPRPSGGLTSGGICVAATRGLPRYMKDRTGCSFWASGSPGRKYVDPDGPYSTQRRKSLMISSSTASAWGKPMGQPTMSTT